MNFLLPKAFKYTRKFNICEIHIGESIALVLTKNKKQKNKIQKQKTYKTQTGTKASKHGLKKIPR